MRIPKLNHLPFESGIYCIRCLVDGKVYVGQSQVLTNSKGIRSRCHAHYSSLRLGKDTRYLQAAWDTYGEENFVFEVLVLCPNEECGEQENRFIHEKRSWEREFGYNIDRKHKGIGRKSQETIEKIQSPESRKKRSIAMKGRVMITNGGENRWHQPNEPLPEGFSKGVTKWKEREIKQNMKGTTTVWNPVTGEIKKMSVSDPAYASGEWVHIAKKKYLDGTCVSKRALREQDRITPKNPDRARGSVWVNDGVRNKRVPEGSELPEGWKPGRLKTGNTGRNQHSPKEG